MTDDNRMVFADAFRRWFQGDAAAVALCLDLLDAAHVWDDLVDGDKPVPADQITATFRRLLVDIPANPFYRRWQAELLPVLASALVQWQTANVFEQDRRPHDMAKAYMLRAGLYHVFAHVAWLIGGPDWAAAVGPEVWRLYGEAPETFMGVNHA